MSNIHHQPHDKLVGKLLADKKAAIDLLKNHLPTKSLEKLNLLSAHRASIYA